MAARYDGSALRIFINGTQETASTQATESLAATTEALWLGFHNDHRFNGYLNDVSLYNRALSDAEITNLSNKQAERYEYHHTNALGSNIILTDDVQTVLIRYEYDVFGAVRSEAGTSDNSRKFTGKEYESDVKLYYFAARYYDPYIGRFTQRDPAGDGINWYAYAYNNPLSFIDPSGLRPVNDLEETALLYTFGDHMGSFLASIIDVHVKDKPFGAAGRVSYWTKTDIDLSPDYHLSPNKDGSKKNTRLFWLSVFIHEATHIWQKQTKRHRGGTGGEDYDYETWQLDSLNLKREEHAQAVQDWFFASWGRSLNWLVNPLEAWWHLDDRNLELEDMNFTDSSPWNSYSFLSRWVDTHYGAVINEIRDSSIMPVVAMPNYPNPF